MSARPARAGAGPRGTVVVVGSVNIDHVIATPRIPRPGETLIGGPTRQQFGGKGANQAIAASRLGARTHLVGCIGSDREGVAYRDHLRRVGVGDSGLAVSSKPTGRADVFVTPEGENCIVVDPAANADFNAGVARSAHQVLTAADVVVISLEIPLDAAHAVIEIAHRTHRRVVLNPAPAHPDAPYHLLGPADVITPNQHEAELIAPVGPSGLTSHTNVVITRGRAGAELHQHNAAEVRHIAAPQVRAIDTTGAGDAFTGALAWALASGAALDAAVEAAVAVSAYAVTSPGAQLEPLPEQLRTSLRSAIP